MSVNRDSDDIDKKVFPVLPDQTGLGDRYNALDKLAFLYSKFVYEHFVGFSLSLLVMYFCLIFIGFTFCTLLLPIEMALMVLICFLEIYSRLRLRHIDDDVIEKIYPNQSKEEDVVQEETATAATDVSEDENNINLWKLARRYYEIYRHQTPEKKKLAYELRHRILDFMDFYDYAEGTEYEDEADELYDRMYYDLNRTCDIIEKVDSDDRQVIDNILISTFHGLSWVFAECDDIIERMMEIYDTITADDRKVETDVLFKPVVTSSVPTITKKEEKPAKNDPEIEDLYSVRNARLFTR